MSERKKKLPAKTRDWAIKLSEVIESGLDEPISRISYVDVMVECACGFDQVFDFLDIMNGHDKMKCQGCGKRIELIL